MQVSPDNAPGQVTMESSISINIDETLFTSFPGEGRQQFMKGHVDLCDLFCMMMFPCICAKVPFSGKKDKLIYKKEFGLCSCPWAVLLNGITVGRAVEPRCCDNGCWFACCPFLTCGGHLKLMGLTNASGQEKFTFLRELFCCWPLCIVPAALCRPVCMVCISHYGCCKYCGGNEIQTVTQPIYGPWSRADSALPQKIGEFVITQRFVPAGCCNACPYPMKVYFRPTTQAGMTMAKEDMSLLAMVLQLYRGMPVPCKLFGSGGFQAATGIPMADWGLNSSVSWINVDELMAFS